MYASFFGLQQQPFSIAPDPRYLFMSERHREALAHLLYGLDAGGGFVLLTGDVGTGKTTVCRCFLEQIPAHCNVAYIFNPKLTVLELLRSICDEFGVPHQPAVAGAETAKDCIDPLNIFLLAAHAGGRNNVLIIDEAQNLAPDVLEQLRLLTNLETSERKLLQIILIGQPELRTMVAQPSMEQLAQRVIARYHLNALSFHETRQYVAHRLSVAGLQGPLPFSENALRRIYQRSGGVPRRINLLCDRALLGAYAAGVRVVSDAVVRTAAREVFDVDQVAPGSAQVRQGVRPLWLGLGALGIAALAAGVGWSLRGQPTAVVVPAAEVPVVVPQPSPQPALQPVLQPLVPAVSPPVAEGASLTAEQALAPFLAAQSDDENAVWQALAGAWGQAVPRGVEPCGVLQRRGVACYRNRRAGLTLLRDIDRPAILRIADANGRAVPVLLRGLTDDTALLEGEKGSRLALPLKDLATVWQGEALTLWRTPPDWNDLRDLTKNTDAARWVDLLLSKALKLGQTQAAQPVTAAVRRDRVRQFQSSQGLASDGQIGPLTLMLLNREAGVSEPRLRTGS